MNRLDESGNESRMVGNDEFMNTLLRQTEFRMLLNLLSIYAGRINTSITNPGGGIKVFTMMAANGWENMMLGYGMRDMRLALMGAGEMIAGAMGATIMVALFIGFIYQGSLLGAMALDGEVGFPADVNYT